MTTQLVGAIDQGTTSTRFMVFDEAGAVLAVSQREHRQIFPEPGWVEHDPVEILQATKAVITEALRSADLRPADLAAVGITNQRETVVAWDRSTGRPLSNAIVWQDTRTAQMCRALEDGHGPDRFRALTGLPISTYFSGPKIAWVLDSNPGLRGRAESGEIAVGTIDSWLLWNLGRNPDGGDGPVHLTDVTNASRTLLFDINELRWSSEACDAIGIPLAVLPGVRASSGVLAIGTGPLDGVPIAGVLGDQQASLFGQRCFDVGDVKNTYGTGCFMLQNTGTTPVPSRSGLITTVAYQLGDDPAVYALEGSVAIAGALVQWLRDNLGIIERSEDIEALARSVADCGDVYFVPAFNGLFAPRWRPDARGVVVGLTRFANRGHLARAALEATAFQTREVLDAMRADSDAVIDEIRVDGGMVANELLMQMQADVTGLSVRRSEMAETTALGAAFAAGLAVGVWAGLDELRAISGDRRRWLPNVDETEREHRYARWKHAVDRSLGWVENERGVSAE